MFFTPCLLRLGRSSKRLFLHKELGAPFSCEFSRMCTQILLCCFIVNHSCILEASNTLSWLNQNEIIANPNKFHALFVKKDQTDTSGLNLEFLGQSIQSAENVKLLGVTLDYKLNFDPHTSNICKKAASQLNVLKCL